MAGIGSAGVVAAGDMADPVDMRAAYREQGEWIVGGNAGGSALANREDISARARS
jgi:ribulose 1,5-bisphosphate synthetase/thiazole synthase